jgi:hypothetical protein
MPAWWAREQAPALAADSAARMFELRRKGDRLTDAERRELLSLEANRADTIDGQVAAIRRAG